MAERCEVAIVGGGPVGLLLGCLLSQYGVDVRVLERELSRPGHARAVGIHPPGLACLAQIGALERVLAAGVLVRRAFAFGDDARAALGTVSFGALNGPYPFVLCAPQRKTEQALEARLGALSTRALRRGHEVVAFRRETPGMLLWVRSLWGHYPLRARFVIGCDGEHSRVRSAAHITSYGGSYGAHFAMADLEDRTPFGPAAAVFLARDGLVESFPLPRGRRRWVVGLEAPVPEPSAALLERLVFARTGQSAPAASATMVSTFTAEHYLAERFVADPLILAGDAAHVLSPIGGQGMNLGWLDAELLATSLVGALDHPARAGELLRHYERARRRAAQAATRRSELFMLLGRGRRLQGLRERTVAHLLSPRWVEHAARTMAGLASFPHAERARARGEPRALPARRCEPGRS